MRDQGLGNAVGCLVARSRGAKLKRSGVQLLARYRKRIAERFDLKRGLAELVERVGGRA